MEHKKTLRCAIYTRKSSEEGLEQSFNSLDAQREACEAYAKSQQHEGWKVIKESFDDGGFSGGTIERPALTRLIEQIKRKLIDIIIVYKVDRLSRSLSDFVKLVELFDQYKVSFVSVTQQFNTSTSMGRLTLNVLLSFAQFEREVTGERIRDKIAASKQKGMWMGGGTPLGYDVKDRTLIINRKEARTVVQIYDKYLQLKSVRSLKEWLDHSRLKSKQDKSFSRGALYTLLQNPVYIGKIRHKEQVHAGSHEPIVDEPIWDAVQNVLQANRHQHQQQQTESRALLSGLLFDDQGNALSPTHTKKGNKRYYYYVNQALLKYKGTEAGEIKRVSLPELDTQVIQFLQSSTVRNELIKKLLQKASARQFQKLDTQLRKLLDIGDIEKGNQNSRMRQLCDQIILHRRSLECIFALPRIGDALDVNCEDATHTIRQPITWKRWGAEQKLILGEDNQTNIPAHSIKVIQNAVMKALIWNEELLSGSVASVRELETREQAGASYVRRILRLAYLSPTILQDIAYGKIPEDLSLEATRLTFPPGWEQQSRIYIHR